MDILALVCDRYAGEAGKIAQAVLKACVRKGSKRDFLCGIYKREPVGFARLSPLAAEHAGIEVTRPGGLID